MVLLISIGEDVLPCCKEAVSDICALVLTVSVFTPIVKFPLLSILGAVTNASLDVVAPQFTFSPKTIFPNPSTILYVYVFSFPFIKEKVSAPVIEYIEVS
jgi:hypothetical protein